MGRVPRAAKREGSAGAVRRCPWLWCQGRGSGSWHLLSPCREARTAPTRQDSKWLLCLCAVNREQLSVMGRGAASQGGPPAPLQPMVGEPSQLGCPRPHTACDRPQPCPPWQSACSASLVSPMSCRVRLCQGGRSMEEQPEEPSKLKVVLPQTWQRAL